MTAGRPWDLGRRTGAFARWWSAGEGGRRGYRSASTPREVRCRSLARSYRHFDCPRGSSGHGYRCSWMEWTDSPESAFGRSEARFPGAGRRYPSAWFKPLPELLVAQPSVEGLWPLAEGSIAPSRALAVGRALRPESRAPSRRSRALAVGRGLRLAVLRCRSAVRGRRLCVRCVRRAGRGLCRPGRAIGRPEEVSRCPSRTPRGVGGRPSAVVGGSLLGVRATSAPLASPRTFHGVAEERSGTILQLATASSSIPLIRLPSFPSIEEVAAWSGDGPRG
jgi:hypothetical protein